MTHTAGAVARRPLSTEAVLWVVAAVAWLLTGAAHLSGAGALLHHDALIESGPPIPVAVALFSVSWLAMVAAMMLPASAGVIAAYAWGAGTSVAVRRAPAEGIVFVGAFFGVWLAFGLACFVGDAVLHRVVDATPGLAARPWLIEAGAVAGAGAYQFTGLKRRALELCRRPLDGDHLHHDPLRAGFAHALDCVVAAGPLMALTFAAGFANLEWMIALTLLMVYEARGRHGQGAARAAGLVLLFLAIVSLTNQGLPAWPAA